MAKKSTDDLKKDQKEKKVILPTSMKSMKDAKVWITWLIAIAFVLTSGIMLVGIGLGSRGDGESKNEVKAKTPLEQHMQKLEADLRYAEEQVRERPDEANVYSQLADAHKQMNNLDLAVENYKKAYEMDPSFVPYLRYLAEAYAMQDKFDEALKVLDEAMEKDPKDARNDVLAGNIYYNQRKLEQAAARFEAAVKKDSGEPAYYAFLAKVLEESGHKDKAREVINEGLEIAKIRNNQRYRSLLEEMLVELDKTPEDKINELKGTSEAPDERKFRPANSPASDASAPQAESSPAASAPIPAASPNK